MNSTPFFPDPFFPKVRVFTTEYYPIDFLIHARNNFEVSGAELFNYDNTRSLPRELTLVLGPPPVGLSCFSRDFQATVVTRKIPDRRELC